MHENAELSMKEFNTSNKIIEYLHTNLNIPHDQIKKCTATGIIVDIHGKAEPKGKNLLIALRADIDA